MNPDRLAVGPRPFAEANVRLFDLLQVHGFRLAGLEAGSGRRAHAFAEYFRRELRVRLVWEGNERVLWVEAARQAGGVVISRWLDVEWSLAREPLPLNRDTSEARVEQLAAAVTRYLADTFSSPPRLLATSVSPRDPFPEDG